MNVVYLGLGGAWGANILVAGVPTQIPPVESYTHDAITIVNGVITEIDFSVLGGGGGTTDHSALSNLSWEDSAHTGTSGKLAGFGTSNAAREVTVGTGLSLSGNVLSCTVSATTNHAALSNLAWNASGHTGSPDTVAGFGPTGNPGYYTVSGLTDHAFLTHLAWAVSGHTGTAKHVPFFNAAGAAATSTDLTYDTEAKELCVPHLKATASSTFAGVTVTGTLTVTDNQFSLSDNADPTKVARFDASLIPTGNALTYTLPGANATLVGTDTAQSLTNKKLGSLTTNGVVRTTGGDGTLAVDGVAISCGGRLTLESGVPFSTTDQTAKTSVLWTPYNGNTVPIYDATVTQFFNRTFSELSAAVPSTQFRLFDIFAYWTGSAVALETTNWDQTTASISAFNAGTQTFTTSAAHGLSVGDLVGIAGITGTVGSDSTYGVNGRVWAVATVPSTTTFTLFGSNLGSLAYSSGGTVFRIPNTRATALTRQNGILVKSGDATRTYLGTGMTTGVSGQTEMSFGVSEPRLLLWNNYNRHRTLARAKVGTYHTYTTVAWRYWDNNPANRILAVVGETVVGDAVLSADCYGGSGLIGFVDGATGGAGSYMANGNAYYVSLASAWIPQFTAGLHQIGAGEWGTTGFTTTFAELFLAIEA